MPVLLIVPPLGLRPPLGRVKVGNNEDALAKVPSSNLSSGNLVWGRFVAQSFQVFQDGNKSSGGNSSGDVLAQDEPWSALFDDSTEVWPEPALVREPLAFSCETVRLARIAACHDINASPKASCVKGSNVVIHRGRIQSAPPHLGHEAGLSVWDGFAV
jgi:hypothetical protein